MPDVSFPSITVRVGYAGVGPLEMEELVTRPIEQAMSAVAGLERLESTSSEGSSRVTLNFAWGTDLNEAADDVRNRLDRVRGRLPEEADAPVMFKFDANAHADHGRRRRGRLRPRHAARDRRARPVAAARARARRRRRSPSKAACAGRSTSSCRRRRSARSTCRSTGSSTCCAPRTRTSRSAKSTRATRTYLVRSQGQFENLDEIRDLVVMTRQGVPVYMRDIAEVKDSTEDFRIVHPHQRQARRPPARHQAVGPEHGADRRRRARGNRRASTARSRRIRLAVLDDSSVFIKRVDRRGAGSTRCSAALLVMLIIFLFLRDLRATIIVFTSIPISVIGTFALLYFAGYTLNTMTFGGLALGIGMIVDASIVVLENTFRHMEHGKDRMQASIDGSEEVWSAILASTLTHIAVFVPLLFLTGVSSILFKQLSIVVMFSLTMSLFVAVTIVPVLCSRLLKLPPPVEQRRGRRRPALHVRARTFLDGMDDGLQPADPRARCITGRRSSAVGTALVGRRGRSSCRPSASS